MLRTGDLQGGPPETTQSAIKSELVKDALHKEMSETLMDGVLYDVKKGAMDSQNKLDSAVVHNNTLNKAVAGILNDKNTDY